jgi:hypothetical protein
MLATFSVSYPLRLILDWILYLSHLQPYLCRYGERFMYLLLLSFLLALSSVSFPFTAAKKLDQCILLTSAQKLGMQ